MTKKPYPKVPRVSRSGRPARNSPQPRRRPSRDDQQRSYPFLRAYATLGGSGEHPVDTIVDRLPEIALLDRKLRRVANRYQAEIKDAAAFIAYEDARLDQRLQRQEAFFDAGHHEGRITGILESLSASVAGSARARELARQLRLAIMTTVLPPDRIVAALLELARALVLGQQLPMTHRRRTSG
jgi:hypothetical protein